MVTLPISLITASVLGLMLVWLSARAIAARVKGNALIGDQGDTNLLFAIRTHGNFTEYAPLFLILLGLLELTLANQTLLIGLSAVFILSRLLHVFGMGAEANLKLRQAGMVGTFTCLVVASLYGVYIVLL